jgi:exosortase
METYLRSDAYRPALAVRLSRNLSFLALWVLSLAVFRIPLTALVELALRDERYSYVLLVPVVSAFLIWLRKDRLVVSSRYSPRFGIPLVFAGGLLAVTAGRLTGGESNAALSLTILALTLIWAGIGAFCFGPAALRSALFPTLFLFLFVPLPENIMHKAVVALQTGSADMTAALFKLIGLPFTRNGFVFALPGVDIEVAEECSGIRSAVVFFLGGVLGSYIFLRRGWTRLSFVLLTIPVVILKNAVRIATISWLGVNVDHGYFTGNLHHYGGLPFSLLAVALLLPILWVLLKAESKSAARRYSVAS